MEDVHVFLESHINTKRAKKSTPIVLAKSEYLDNQLNCLMVYKFNFHYPSDRLGPSYIKIGIKDGRVCIRVDELERQDRAKYIDYFADDLSHLRKFMTHLSRLQQDYDRTTWFLRAQFIPSLFAKLLEMLRPNQSSAFVC